MRSLFVAKGIIVRANGAKFEGITTAGEIIGIFSFPNGQLGFRKYGRNLETTKNTDGTLDLYIDSYNLRAIEENALGISDILYREIKPDLSERQLMTFNKKLSNNDLSSIGSCTNSLLNYVHRGLYNV